ncbi:MAG TPA: glycosyltransferase family protein [Verrucomicrobiae bacterium]|nr:glycosyltransferase family protein [Verrucomicrobiae bacterium]
MLTILGEGRGHMTQAMAVKQIVEQAGHQVTSVVVGLGAHRQIPAFFSSAMKMPIHRIATLDFSYNQNRGVNLPKTLAGIVRKTPAYLAGLRKIRSLVRETKPDVIVNFFEPLTGIYSLISRKRPPVVSVAHQFMFGHPDYVRLPGKRVEQLGMKWFVELVGARSSKVALSFYEAPNQPRKRLRVCPPILRPQLFDLESRHGNFVLAYLLNHGYAEQLIAWHKKNPGVKVHCFYDKPGAPEEFQFDDTLTFHRLDGDKFLRLMAECRHVACTAGFESLAEAAYLGKPLFLMPVENHVEQQINAIDAVRTGWGVSDTSFNLDRLKELPDALENGKYHAWLNRGNTILLKALEDAVTRKAQSHVELIPAEA